MSPRHVTEEEFKQYEAIVAKRAGKVRAPSALKPRRGGTSGGHGDSQRRSGADSRLPKLPPSPRADKPKFKSKWEENYASKLELEKLAGLIKAYYYEPFSLWLPGKVRYKPDFMVQYADQPGYHKDVMIEPRLEIIEVKGWSKNRRDGITRLKIAAAIYSCFVWRLVYRTKNGGWDGEYL